MGNLMSIFFPKAAAPAPLEQVATQGGEPNVVRVFIVTFVQVNQYVLIFTVIVVSTLTSNLSSEEIVIIITT